MRRPLLLLSFVPLLLTTMGVGPCDPQPLGRVDAGSERPNEPSADGGAQRDTGGGGCTVDGVTYEVGRAVPSRDDCNTCTCAASGEIACTKVACADAGRDTGGPVVCAFNDARYPAGATFPDTDGCNTCTCGRDGVVACTLRFCIPPDGGAGGAGGNGGVACAYGGVRYEVGVSFRSGDGCNTCTCLADGRVVCTDIACDRDGGVGGACVVGDTKYEAGATFPSRDGCNTCTCNRDGTIACTERACPPDAGRDTRDEVCRVGEDWTCKMIPPSEPSSASAGTTAPATAVAAPSTR
jgi:hypothetical protein